MSYKVPARKQSKKVPRTVGLPLIAALVSLMVRCSRNRLHADPDPK